MTSKFISSLREMLKDPKTNINWVLDSDVESELRGNYLISFDHTLKSQLSKYFKTDKLESFIRQLNYYGFRCLSKKNKSHPYIYYNKEFTKDDKTNQIKRKKTKKSDDFHFLFPFDDQDLKTEFSEYPLDKYLEYYFPVK
tara:strand:- start:288 stop:707 length:420 start_codon:yes stop_codon:yes gene_type:complete